MFTRAKVLKNVVLTCPNDVFFEKYGDFVGKLTENAYFCPAFQKMHVKNGINIYEAQLLLLLLVFLYPAKVKREVVTVKLSRI